MKVGLAALAAWVALAAPVLAEPPPVLAFGRIPAVIAAAISPDGQHVALLGGGLDKRIVSIATLDQPGLPSLSLGEVEGVGLRWAGRDHVLVRLAYWKPWTAHLSYRFERNLVVDLQANPVSTLLQHDPNSMWLLEQPVLAVTSDPERAYVLGLSRSNGANSDIGSHLHSKSVDHPFLASLFQVDPATGAGSSIEVGGYDTIGWELDAAGAPRLRVDLDDENRRVSILHRPAGGGRYAPIWSADFAHRFAYAGYASAENAIYLLDRDQLVRMNIDTGVREPVGPHLPRGSANLVWDTGGHRLVGIEDGYDTAHFDWLDPSVAAAHASLAKAFKGRRVDLKSWSADGSHLVARVTSHDTPAVWYLYDRARGELSPLGEEYPELKGVAFGTTHWISFKARDGLVMGAYLTLPPGLAANAKAPLIVLPHGGPASRDDEDFDFLAQFLATRGYAVLRPEFRGSHGFGQAFEDAGRAEWGSKMQTDLLDAMAAAAVENPVDPQRACIVGWSFGGYAAMAGAAFHSDRYRCAFSYAGISSLGLLLNEEARSYGRDSASMEELRGDVGSATLAQLEAASPAKHAASVAIPLMLIHGDQDTVVPLEQSQLMARAMAAAGKPMDLVVLSGENHYLTRTQTRAEMLTRLGAFLAKNLPVTP
jgi:dipeptidyl aminopeptidase/acylaminoacyl peptidase